MNICKKNIACLTLLLVFCTADLFAQETDTNNDGEVPDNWMVRLDDPDREAEIGSDPKTSDIYFVNMSPGWHITTGPRAIFYPEDNTVSGTYSVSSKIHLFDPEGRNEAFGIFIGGEDLQQDNQTYTYFLLRNSGEYLIKKRDGNETGIVKDWTATDAMATFTDTTEFSVPNTLTIEVMENEVAFYVNDQRVETLPKNQLDTEGIVGLRINHRLNVHVENLDVEEM